MKLKAFGATEQRIYNAVKPIADEFGFQIWDVRFEKEGACWYLRIFIDLAYPVNKEVDTSDSGIVVRPAFYRWHRHGSACPHHPPH